MLRIGTASLAFVFALAFATVSPLAIQSVYGAPPAPPGPPTITSSSTTATQLTINGTGFSPGAVSVLLGKYGPLAVATQTATQIVVTLPAGLSPGNYVLSVKVGPGAGKVDESVVTIGAAGLQGPPGAGLNTGSITGQVTGCHDVTIDRSLVYVPGMPFVVYTGETGHFTLLYLPAGTYSVVIETPNQGPRALIDVDVQSGQVTAAPLIYFPGNCGGVDGL